MPFTCPTEPTPDVPIKASSGCEFSQAMKPLRSSAGMTFLATIACWPLASHATGAKAVRKSYGRLRVAPLITWVPQWPLTSA